MDTDVAPGCHGYIWSSRNVQNAHNVYHVCIGHIFIEFLIFFIIFIVFIISIIVKKFVMFIIFIMFKNSILIYLLSAVRILLCFNYIHVYIHVCLSFHLYPNQ